MQKITFLVAGIRNLMMGICLISFSVLAHDSKWDKPGVLCFGSYGFGIEQQDKNILKGSWQMEGSAVELQVLRVFKSGTAEVKYLNAKRIAIQKSGWTNSSGILRLFVLFSQNEQADFSLSLQYDAKKDILYGSLQKGANGSLTTVLFRRVR